MTEVETDERLENESNKTRRTMAATSLPPFEKFNVHAEEHTAGTRWKKYLACFELLIQAMNLQDKPTRKKALLIHYAGEEVFDIFDTFSDEQKGGEDEMVTER